MSVDEKKVAKKKRTTAKSKFTRTMNILQESIDSDEPMGHLHSLFADFQDAYEGLERTNDDYLMLLDSGDEEDIDNANKMMETSYRNRCSIHAIITKKSNDDDSLKPKEPLKTPWENNIRVKKLEAPKFCGKIRDFPTFIKDYTHYMEPTYGNDTYALRNCLSGKALDVVAGVDDDYDEMWKRLKSVFGDSEKVVDSILFELILPAKNYLI